MVRAVISLAINPLIAMNMTHYDYALTGFYTSFNSLLLPIFSLMYGQYYSRNFFKLKTDEERDQLGSDLLSSRLVFNVFELIFILLAFTIYARVQNIEFPVFPYAVITFSTIIFNSIYTFYLLKLKMRKNAKGFFMVSLYHALVLPALSILLVVVFKLGALGKLSAMFLTAFLFTAFLYPKISKGFRLKKDVIVDSLKFCWPLILAASSGYFLRGFDRALLVNINDSVQLGLYNVAITISGFLMIFQTSINNTFQPDIFEAVAQDNKKKLFIVLGGISFLNLIPIIVFVILAPLIFSLLTAGRFTEAYTYARILAFRNITSGMAYSITGVLIAYGYTKISMISEIGGAIISIFLFKYLIGKYQFFGAAWGQVFSYFGIILIALIFIFIKVKNKNNLTLGVH